jgi:signal transduction histidine kinase
MISILHVDDERALLEITKLFLESSGDFIVHSAGSAQEGLAMLAKTGIDAIVSDYQMPETDGIAFLKIIRASGNTIPFIIFTGKGREEIAIDALNSGADFYLRKGSDPQSQFSELGDKIRQAVRRKQREESLQRMNKKLRILSSTTRHDINNKLTILSGYSGLMKEMVTDEKIQSFISIQENAITDITKILKFTKEYEQVGVEVPAWLKVHSVFSSAISQIQIKPLMLSDTTGGLQIYADAMLERVFYHLAENVVYHAQSATALRTGYTIAGEDCILWIEDDGPGIPPEDKEKIFQRGFGKNTGLGLYLSREILAITDLEIHETGEFGTGARFEIRVPRGKYRVVKDQ